MLILNLPGSVDGVFFVSFFLKRVISQSWTLADILHERQPSKMSPEQCWLPHRPCFPAQFGLSHNIMKMHSKKLLLQEKLSHFKVFIVNVHLVLKHIQQPSRMFLFNLQKNKENIKIDAITITVKRILVC